MTTNTEAARGLGMRDASEAARCARTTNNTHELQVAIRFLEDRAQAWEQFCKRLDDNAAGRSHSSAGDAVADAWILRETIEKGQRLNGRN